uniref:Protein RRP5 homolog n=1 Tax=Pygocentrus nattereri TaxID=42514 RepID=A0AAR2JIK4_PYGNA
MASMEEDFPRGGPAKKSSESKAAKPPVEVDNLFKVSDGEPAVKKKRTGPKKQEDGRAAKKQKSEVGTLMLGCVKEVSDIELLLGLPNGLRGFLPISNICEAYSKTLSEKLDSVGYLEVSNGQLVRCVVSYLDLSREGFVCLKVSINPKDVNKELNSSSLKAGMTLGGCVESVEDHGFLIDIGISGTKAFLPKDKTNETKSPKQDLKVGQYVTSLVTEVKNEGRVARLSRNHAAVSQACAETEHGWTLGNLAPGLLVKACIKKCSNVFDTTATHFQVKARILYVEPSTRLVGLSLRSHLLLPRGDVLECATSDRIGMVLEGCKMTAVHHHSGAIMELPGGDVLNELRKISYCDFSLIFHFISILSYSFIHSYRSTIAATYFSYHDIKEGQLIEGMVQNLEKYGMHIKISDHIKGLIPRLHLADVTLTNPEKKFKEGMKVKCRVLFVDPVKKKLILSRKKALIESTLPLFLSYLDARVGLISHGYIVTIKDFGCIVRFYGDVKGLVPKQELTASSTVKPQSLFYVGQVVKAKVLRCEAEKEKLVLSFKAVTQEDVACVQTGTVAFEVGKKVEVMVLKKDLTGLQVSILPEEVPALLPMVHLSDHVTNWPLLWEGLQEGDTISNTVYLSKSKQGIILTKKPLLVAALEAGDVVKSFSELQVGMIMLGWVKSIMPYGVFIGFPYGLYGLAPKAAMSDKFIADTEGVFQIGQTVLAKVTNLDEEKHRFLVSLNVSEVSLAEEEGDTQARLIQGQRERMAVHDMMTSRGDSELLQKLSSVSLGDKLKMTIGQALEDGSVSLISEQLKNLTVLASKYHITGQKLLTSIPLKDKPLFYVYLLQSYATVQYVDKDFAVILLGDTGHLTVVSTTTHLNETFRFETEKLTEGSDLTVTVTDLNCAELQGRLLVACQLVGRTTKRHRTTYEKGDAKCSYKVGDLVTVKIKTVKPTQVVVALEEGITGNVHVSEIQESPEVGSFPTSYLKVGTEVKGRVIGCREVRGHKFLPFSHPNFVFSLPELTLLPRYMVFSLSHTLTQTSHIEFLQATFTFPVCFVTTGTHKLEQGTVAMGTIHKIIPQMGLALKLPFGSYGSASITDLSDTYTEKPLEQYKEGQVIHLIMFYYNMQWSYFPYCSGNSDSVVGFVFMFSVDAESKRVDLSLLPEDTGEADILPESLGLPLRLRGKEKEEHDKITAKRKRKISENDQVHECLCSHFVKKKKPQKTEKDSEKKNKKQKSKLKQSQAEDLDSGVEVYFREEETQKEKKKDKSKAEEHGRLQVASAFSWDIDLNTLKPASVAENTIESSDDEQDNQSKKSRREMAQERQEAERSLNRLEAELMDASARPESSEAFERLILSSPDSSLLWLQYMAFHLQATQIEQARAVAERALKTISFREEQEKQNVWVALLNLENMYGTEESLQKVFERAVLYCEPMPVHQQLADIYAKSNKIKEAESLYKKMVKRFRQEKAVWQSYGSFLLRQGQRDAADALLQRALQSLSNKDHVDLITKFARLEFQYGNRERARAMFDQVLTSYPKRTDLWSVFIDLMVKHGSQKDVRDLFDRVIHLSVSVKKIKFFFKRYLDYEKKHGTPESIQAVKQKALEYVEAKGTEATS